MPYMDGMELSTSRSQISLRCKKVTFDVFFFSDCFEAVVFGNSTHEVHCMHMGGTTTNTTGEGKFVMICHKYNLGRKMIVVLNSSYVIERFPMCAKQHGSDRLVACLGMMVYPRRTMWSEAFQMHRTHRTLCCWVFKCSLLPGKMIPTGYFFYVLHVFFIAKHGCKCLIVFHNWRLVQVSVFLRVLHSDTGHSSV